MATSRTSGASRPPTRQRWQEYERTVEEIRELRAVIAASTALGVFRLGEAEEGNALLERLRQAKTVDPALAVYAAHAFNDRRMRPQIVDLQRHLDASLGVRVFDVAMLAFTIGKKGGPREMYPCVPCSRRDGRCSRRSGSSCPGSSASFAASCGLRCGRTSRRRPRTACGTCSARRGGLMRQLILIHGRAQQEKDAAGIKKEWMTAWEKGLAKSGLTNPLTDADVHFPFYGDTLAQMVAGKSAQEAAEVIIKGPRAAVSGAGPDARDDRRDRDARRSVGSRHPRASSRPR